MFRGVFAEMRIMTFFLLPPLAQTAFAWDYDSRRHIIDRDDLIHAETLAINGIDVPPEYTIDLPIDHFNLSDTRTFENHYWVNDTYYQPGGPVFLYDGGEATVSDADVLVLLAEVAGP